MSDEDDNVLDKATRRAESGNRLVYSMIALISSLVVCAVFSNGAANTGLGKTLGDGWRSIGAVVNDTYCAAIGQPEESCPSVGDSIGAWFDKTKKDAGKKLAGLEELENPTEPAPGGSPVTPGAPPSNPTSVPPSTPVAGPSQGLIDAVAQATVNWQTLPDLTATRNALDTILAQYPVEAPAYQPYVSLKAKVDAFAAAWDALINGQKSLWDGQIADPEEFIAALGKYRDACSAYGTATVQWSPNPFQEQIDNCTKTGDQLLAIIKAWVDAAAGEEANFVNTVSTAWSGTSWTITEWDDRVGSCHCATLTSTGPLWLDGLVLDQIPTNVLQELFPDQTGAATTEVGQEITWP